MAIIDWQKLDLPDNFHAIYARDFGVEKGAVALQFNESNGELLTIPIENSFVFTDDVETTFIFGYTFILRTPDLRNAFADKQDDLAYLESQMLSPELIDVPGIGDVSGGHTALLSERERIDSAEFLIYDVAASLFIRYPEGQPPPLDVVKLAEDNAESLLNPPPRCEFLSITPVEGALLPTFDFEAAGFFPEEQRIVELFGVVGDEDEPITTANSMPGQTGDTSDSDGKVSGTISLGPVMAERETMPVISLELTVTGGFSGCTVSEELSWSAPQEPSEEIAENQAASEAQGYIAFEYYAEESWGIKALYLQTGKVVDLTAAPMTADCMPELSPDGSRLLFDTEADLVGHEIYMLTSDGTYTRLTDNFAMDTHAVWSPDGGEIAFASDEAGNFDVYVMDLESGEVSRLT